MIQDALFETAPAPASDIPPTVPPKPVVCADPLGECVKCSEPATLKAPSGTLYCEAHGYCGRTEAVVENGKIKRDMHGRVVVKRVCNRSVELFVWSERLQMWCCPCIA